MIQTGYKKELLRIAIPIMFNYLISQLQMLIDRIFLGRLDVIYMSAVGNASAPMWTTMAVLFSLTTGATILISQAMGAEEHEKAKLYTASMFKYNNVFAVLLMLFWIFCARPVYTIMGVSSEVLEPCITYTLFFAPVFLITGLGSSCSALLQTCSNTKPLIISGIIRSGLNIILDWLLIFGYWGFPKMGIGGAALATTIAEFIGGILLVIMIAKDNRLPTKPSLCDIVKAPFKPYKDSIKLGIPTATEDFCWNLGNLMIIRLLNTINVFAAGIYTIVFSIEVIPTAIFMALGNATLTLTGKEIGKKDYTQAKRIGKTVFIWGICIATLNLSMFMIIPRQLMGLFTTNSDIISSAVLYLLIVGFNLFPKSGNIVLGSGIRGYGDTKWMMYTQLFGTCFVVALAASFIYVFKMGILGVFAAVIVDETVRCIINSLRFRRGAAFYKKQNNI